MSVVGIDLGNKSVVIAVAQKGGVDIATNEVSSRQTPAYIGFGEKERFIGEAGLTQYARNIKNTITNVKRLIGRKWNDPEIQQEMSRLPFKTVELPNQEIGVQVMFCGERKTFSVTAVMGMLLQKIREITEKYLQKPAKDVVLSIPGWWADSQRRALLEAAKIGGFNCLRLFPDHAATALGYGIYKTDLPEKDPITVMFIDIGHSNSSVSIVDFLKGQLKVRNAVYDRNLGGRNFDDLLVQHFLKEFKAKYKIEIEKEPRALVRLQVACEKLKHMLSSNPEAPLNIDSIMNDIDVRGTMKRADFEAMCGDLVNRVIQLVGQGLSESGLTAEKLHSIEIVGSACRFSIIKTKLAEFLKREVFTTQNLEESVARGCALQCAMLSPVFKVREFSVTDVYPYPIRVSWKTLGVDQMETENDYVDVFAKNNVVPCPKMVTFRRNEGFECLAQYAQPSLLPPNTSTTICRCKVPNVAAKDGEKAEIRVRIKLDIHGIVSFESVQKIETVEAEEGTPATPTTPTQTPATPTEPTKTGEGAEGNKTAASEEKSKKVKVRRTDLQFSEDSSSLPEKDLQSLVEEEGKMIAADRLAVETADRKNALESYAYEMKTKINENLSEFVQAEQKNTFLQMLEKATEWLYGEGEDTTKSAYVKKLDELQAIGNPIVYRKYEYDNRYDTLSSFQSSMEQLKLTASSQDPQYEHITKEERDKIVAECSAAQQFIHEKMKQQEKLPKHADPILTCAEMLKKKIETERFCNAILSKPKPKPAEKKEEPKPAEKKEEPKPAETKPEEAKPAEQKTQEESKMDLD